MKKLIATILILSLSFPFWIFPQKTKAEEETIQVEEVPEKELEKLENPLLDALEDSANKFEFLNSQIKKGALILSPTDLEAIEEGRVDRRILQTLIYLVTPVEQGGAGHSRIKAQRIVKGYEREKRAQTRESEYKEGEEPNISAHHTGQAVDISEIDYVYCRTVGHSHASDVGFAGREIKEQPPQPIKVAYQTEKGYLETRPLFGLSGRSPNEVFSNIALSSFDEGFSEKMETEILKLKKLSPIDLILALALYLFEESFGLPREAWEKKGFKEIIETAGLAILAKKMKKPPEAFLGQTYQDIALNLGAAEIEESLGLPSGSIKGNSPYEILKNTGRRVLEKELGLRYGELDGDLSKNKDKIVNNPHFLAYPAERNIEVCPPEAPYRVASGCAPSPYAPPGQIKKPKIEKEDPRDEAFNFPKQTVDYLLASDERGLVLIGLSLWAKALNLPERERERLLDLGRRGETNIQIKTDQAVIYIDLSLSDLEAIFGQDKNKRNEVLRKKGESVFDQALVQFAAERDIELTKKDLEDLRKNKIKPLDLILKIGARKYENIFNLPEDTLYKTIKSGKREILPKNNGKKPFKEAAETLNKEFKLRRNTVTEDDILDFLNGKNATLLLKVGAGKLDEEYLLPSGLTYDFLKGKINLQTYLAEVAARRLSRHLGVAKVILSTYDLISGNWQKATGEGKIESQLGLKPGSFKGESLEEVIDKVGEVQFKYAFEIKDPEKTPLSLVFDENSSYWKEPVNLGGASFIDAVLGIKDGETKKLLTKKITPNQYIDLVAKSESGKITASWLSDVLDFFDPEGKAEYASKIGDFANLQKCLSDWGSCNQAELYKTLSNAFSFDLDSWAGFDPGTTVSILENPDKAPEILLNQGAKRLAKGMGLSDDTFIKYFILRDPLPDHFKKEAVAKIKEVTKIPNDEDAASFIDGRIDEGLTFWGIEKLVEYLNDPKIGVPITYEEARAAYYGDERMIEEEAKNVAKEAGENYENWDEQRKENLKGSVRKTVIEKSRKELSYKLIDAQLRKLDPRIPVGFAKVMSEGRKDQKLEMILAYLQNIVKYKEIIKDVDFEVVNELYDFFQTKDIRKLSEATYSWLGKKLKEWTKWDLDEEQSIKVAKGIFAYSATGKMDQGIGEIPSLNEALKDVGREYFETKILQWLDTKLGLPIGTFYQLYQIYQNYKAAEAAYNMAKAANDLKKMDEAKKAVQAAKAEGIGFLAHSLIEACSACKETFAKWDKALNLPPGTSQLFTEGLITYLAGGGPFTLILAFGYAFFAPYRVDYECHCPPKLVSQPLTGKEAIQTILEEFFSKGHDPGWCDATKPEFWMGWAQYKINQIVGELLEMPEKLKDESLLPTQVILMLKETIESHKEKILNLYGKTEEERGRSGVGLGVPPELFWDHIHIGF